MAKETALLRPRATTEVDERLLACGCVPIEDRGTALGMTLALVFLSISAKEVINLTLPSTLPAISRRDVDGRGDMLVALLPGLGTIFYALGKGAQIFVTHAIGARAVLIAVMCGCGALGLLLIAIGKAPLMVLGWATASFGAAHGWGAATQVVSNWVHEFESGRAFAGFGLCSSLSGILASVSFARLLDVPPEGHLWWLAYVGHALVLGIVALLLGSLLRNSAAEAGFSLPRLSTFDKRPPNGLDGLSVPQALRLCMRDARCILLILASCGYACGLGVCHAYVPLYASKRLGASDGEAARLLVFLLMGSLLGGVGMGALRDVASPRVALGTTLGINLVSGACALAWMGAELHGAQLSLPMLAGTCFLLAVSVDVSWTINISVFTVRYAGRDHASTLSGALDLLSFGVKTPFMFLVGGLVAQDAFRPVIILAVLCTLFSHSCMVAFLALDMRLPPCPLPTPADPDTERASQGRSSAAACAWAGSCASST